MKQKFKCPKCGAEISELTSYQEKDTIGWTLYYQYGVRLYCAECAVRTGILSIYEITETADEKLDKMKEKPERGGDLK